MSTPRAEQVVGLPFPQADLLVDSRFNTGFDGWTELEIPPTAGTLTVSGGKLEMAHTAGFGGTDPAYLAQNSAINGGALGKFADIGQLMMEGDFTLDTGLSAHPGGTSSFVGFGISDTALSGPTFLATFFALSDGGGDSDVFMLFGVPGDAPIFFGALGKLSVFGTKTIRLTLLRRTSKTFDAICLLDGELMDDGSGNKSILEDVQLSQFLLDTDTIEVLLASGSSLTGLVQKADNVKVWSGPFNFIDLAPTTPTSVVSQSVFSKTTYPSLAPGAIDDSSGDISSIAAADNRWADASATFLSDPVRPGDLLLIREGFFRGSYKIAAVLSETELRIHGLDDYTTDPFDHIPGVSTKYSIESAGDITSTTQFTDDSKSVDFVAAGVVAGDLLVIRSGTQEGVYEIASGGVATTVLTILGSNPFGTASEVGIEYDIAKAASRNPEGWVVDTELDAVAAGGALYIVLNTIGGGPKIATPTLFSNISFKSEAEIAAYIVDMDVQTPPIPTSSNFEVSVTLRTPDAGENVSGSLIQKPAVPDAFEGKVPFTVGLEGHQGTNFGRETEVGRGLVFNERGNGRSRVRISFELFPLIYDDDDDRLFLRMYFNGLLAGSASVDLRSFEDLSGLKRLPEFSFHLLFSTGEASTLAIHGLSVRKVPLSDVLQVRRITHPPAISRLPLGAPALTPIAVFPGEASGYDGERLLDISRTPPIEWVWRGGRSAYDNRAGFRIKTGSDATVGDDIVTSRSTLVTDGAITTSSWRDTNTDFTTGTPVQLDDWLLVTTGPNAGLYKILSVTGTDTLNLQGTPLDGVPAIATYEVLRAGVKVRSASGTFTTGNPENAGGDVVGAFFVVPYQAGFALLGIESTYEIGSVASATEIALIRPALQPAINATYYVVSSRPGNWAANPGIERTTATDLLVDEFTSYVGVTDTSAPRTITLPPAEASLVDELVVKDESNLAGTNNITVTASQGETVDGAATVVISTNSGFVRLKRVAPLKWVSV